MKTIDRKTLPCKFGEHFTDSVPMPFGSGNCSMPGFECIYDGEIEIPEEMTCNENSECPAYQPVETFICKKHVPNTRYYDFCPTCMDKMERAHEEAEIDRKKWANINSTK